MGTLPELFTPGRLHYCYTPLVNRERQMTLEATRNQAFTKPTLAWCCVTLDSDLTSQSVPPPLPQAQYLSPSLSNALINTLTNSHKTLVCSSQLTNESSFIHSLLHSFIRVCVCVCKTGGSLQESVLLFQHMGARDRTQVVWVGDKSLSLLRCHLH